MSELAKSSRDAMKAKAKRISDGDPHAKTDCSSWSPPEAMNTEAKTGRRPVSRRAFKAGGAVDGEAHKHAGRKARKTGGIVASYAADDTKEANKTPHVGGYKHGGHIDEAEDKKLIKREVKATCMKPTKRSKRGVGGFIKDVAEYSPLVQLPKMILGLIRGDGDGDNDADDKNAKSSSTGATNSPSSKKSGGRAKRAIGGKLNPKTKDKAYGLGFDAYMDGHGPEKEPFSRPRGKTPAGRIGKMDDLAHEWSKGHGAAETEARTEMRYKRGRKAGGKCDGVEQGTRPTGGRCARKDGGRAGKGKTNINIIISAGQKPNAPQMPMAPPPGAPPPMPPMPPAGGPPPGGPMPGAGGGPPPMMRKDGGRAPARRGPYFSLEAGSGGGLGRLQKAHGKKP